MTVLSAGELRNGEVIIRIGNDYITGVIEDISIRVCSSGFPKFEISGYTKTDPLK